MSRSSRSLALPAIIFSAFFVLACENDGAAKPEQLTPKAQPVAQQVPAAPAAAPPKAGACGMTADEEKEHAGGCGQAKPAQAAAPSGCGCGSHDTGSADKPVVPIKEAKLGDRTRCPVTNSVFVVKTDSPKVDHAGQTYHFCCEGCVTRFIKDPQQFLES